MKKTFSLAAVLAIAISASAATKVGELFASKYPSWPIMEGKYPSWPLAEAKFPKFPAEANLLKFPSWPSEPVESWPTD